MHNIFLCWSGDASKALASELHQWLPTVINAAEPFMSDTDIEAGTRWFDEVATKLSTIRIGIVCLTSSNQSNTWIHFEAGALSSALSDARNKVIILPLDMDKSQIRQPLAVFQAKAINRQEMLNVCRSINSSLDNPINDQLLTRTFGQSWAIFDEATKRIRDEHNDDSSETRRTSEDMLEELIVEMRQQSKTISILANTDKEPSLLDDQNRSSNRVLRELQATYGLNDKLTLGDVIKMAKYQLDEDDWTVVATAPFLYWYLTQFKGITPRTKPSDNLANSDDVPF
jgi:hypothetical protein